MLIELKYGFVDLCYEPQYKDLPFTKLVTIRSNNWDALKNIKAISECEVYFDQHDPVYPFAGFAPVDALLAELNLQRYASSIDWLAKDVTPAPAAFKYTIFEQVPEADSENDWMYTHYGFVYPDEVNYLSEHIDGPIEHGFVWPLHTIPTELVEQRLTGGS